MQNPTSTLHPAQNTPSVFNRNASVHPYTPPAKLPDLAQIQINPALPIQERIQHFIADIGNPYLFRVSDTVVHVRYSSQPATLQDRLTRLASR